MGFVRTDMAEGMAQGGEINLADIKVIVPYSLGYPWPSTNSEQQEMGHLLADGIAPCCSIC